MNELDSRDALDFFMSGEEQSILDVCRNLADLAEEQKRLDKEFKQGMQKDRDFWEECRLRSIQLNK
jgi:hypothetical protein